MNEFEELIKNYNIKNKEDYDFLEKVKNIIERKDNIIKEVREELRKWYESCSCELDNYYFNTKMLEILEKVEENK